MIKVNDPVEKHFRLQLKQKTALKKLGIVTIENLLYHLPHRYADLSTVSPIQNLKVGEYATVFGVVSGLKVSKTFNTKVATASANLADIHGNTIKLTWFNQPYLAKMLKNDTPVKVTGQVTSYKTHLTMVNPEIKHSPELPIDHHDSLFSSPNNSLSFGIPVYRESQGINSRWFYHSITKLLANKVHEQLTNPISLEIERKYSLPTLSTSMVWIHNPKKESDAVSARKRFAFQEIYLYQKEKHQSKLRYQQHFSYPIKVNRPALKKFMDSFPFSPTSAQKNVIKTVLEDIEKHHPMSRLLQGDVGSGKTFVASVVSEAIISQSPTGQDFGQLQVAYMAPTEVLAIQLFENFIEYFSKKNISIGLLTGSECRKFPSKVNPKGWTKISKTQLKKWVANGEIPILIGTHSLIYKTVKFPHLAMVIIDEEHRFGTKQRETLIQKDNRAPHVLSMSATPIPRTLALTIYGDLDISILDEYPPGRKPVITSLVHPSKREEVYEHIRSELQNGRQAYVICPRIDEPDEAKAKTQSQKSVASEVKKLSASIFPEHKVAGLHSKMSKEKKQKVMQDFYQQKIDILVSTSVIEVGVNVPNATLIIIEGAERFGLAQLHQLRGRVLRGTHQAFCYLFSDSKTEKTNHRLSALAGTASGFDLAEIDLSLRGSGDLAGIKQSGLSDLAMEALKNPRLVALAREAATKD